MHLNPPPTQTQVLVIVKFNNKDILIEVNDEGLWIPLEDQDRIFKRFERAGNPNRPQEHSIGLGLWIISLLAPLIKAEISIVRSSNKGSTFSVTLKEC